MRPNYTGPPSEFYGTGIGQTYEHKGTLGDTEFPFHPPPLVPQPPRLVTLWSKMDATSHIGREARDAIIDKIHTSLTWN